LVFIQQKLKTYKTLKNFLKTTFFPALTEGVVTYIAAALTTIIPVDGGAVTG